MLGRKYRSLRVSPVTIWTVQRSRLGMIQATALSYISRASRTLPRLGLSRKSQILGCSIRLLIFSGTSSYYSPNRSLSRKKRPVRFSRVYSGGSLLSYPTITQSFTGRSVKLIRKKLSGFGNRQRRKKRCVSFTLSISE